MTLFEDPTPAASGPLVRVRALVAYDGTDFHGFAEQPGPRTVGGVLRQALEQVVRQPVELTCAGRTDKGVHAWGQVVSFDVPAGIDLDALQRSLTKLCGPTIAVRALVAGPPDFDARFSARSRTYRYQVLNRTAPDPFRSRYAWYHPAPLEVELLTLACDPFLGEHDFSAFCRRPKAPTGGEPVSLVRRVLRAGWTDEGDGMLRFEIEATAFCHQMVRSIVGTIVAAGGGRLRAGDIRGIIAGRDRAAAAPIAPPEGLTLFNVAYGPDVTWTDPA
ncbi:MAG: tRNA pseudouridine(38-40) synthase TruA [Actinomycetota bacterium]|nr:tRNA pseudouridine(38-40) synthase TruA [Actinomycetota bacterium]